MTRGGGLLELGSEENMGINSCSIMRLACMRGLCNDLGLLLQRNGLFLIYSLLLLHF